MARKITAKLMQELVIPAGKVIKIMQATAKKCGNGAVVYVPKENIGDKFYVVICE